MKCLFIAIISLAIACKGKTENRNTVTSADTSGVTTTKPVVTAVTDTTRYQQFFDRQFNLRDTFSVQVDSATIDGNKIIIVAARDTAFSFTRIVVLKKENNRLQLIDSSGTMEADGRGPHIRLNEDTLIINHGVHRGYTELSYTFDKQTSRFKFFEVTNYEIEPSKDNGSLGVEIYQTYNDLSHQLKVRTELRDFKRYKKLIGTKEKSFARSNQQFWLRDLTDVLLFGEDDIFTVDAKEIQQLADYKK